MESSQTKFGARVYLLNDGVFIVKQTRKSGRTGNYVIDGDKEQHVDPDDVAL